MDTSKVVITLKVVMQSEMFLDTWKTARKLGVPKLQWAKLLQQGLQDSLPESYSLESRRAEALRVLNECALISAFCWDDTRSYYIFEAVHNSTFTPSRMEIAVNTNHYRIKGVKYRCSKFLREKFNDGTFDFVADPDFYGADAREELE